MLNAICFFLSHYLLFMLKIKLMVIMFRCDCRDCVCIVSVPHRGYLFSTYDV